jgi:predicted transcriptional regulator
VRLIGAMSAQAANLPQIEELALLRFGPREGRVLHALWSFEEVTLADLHHLLFEPAISLGSLRSTLEKLRLKRLVRLRHVHRTCYYRAAFDQPTFIRLLHSQLSEFLGSEGMSLLQRSSP